jgi:hypothetical protein
LNLFIHHLGIYPNVDEVENPVHCARIKMKELTKGRKGGDPDAVTIFWENSNSNLELNAIDTLARLLNEKRDAKEDKRKKQQDKLKAVEEQRVRNETIELLKAEEIRAKETAKRQQEEEQKDEVLAKKLQEETRRLDAKEA